MLAFVEKNNCFAHCIKSELNLGSTFVNKYPLQRELTNFIILWLWHDELVIVTRDKVVKSMLESKGMFLKITPLSPHTQNIM